jgi:hypothetical protein
MYHYLGQQLVVSFHNRKEFLITVKITIGHISSVPTQSMINNVKLFNVCYYLQLKREY